MFVKENPDRKKYTIFASFIYKHLSEHITKRSKLEVLGIIDSKIRKLSTGCFGSPPALKVLDRCISNVIPITVGSKSQKIALGTCFPDPVSLKNVLKESSPPPSVESLGI